MFKVSTASSNLHTSLYSLNFIGFSQPCRSVFVDLKLFLDFGDCYRLSFKLAVSLQHSTPHVIVHWVYIQRIWRPLFLSNEILTVDLQPVPCAVCWRSVLLEDEPGGQPAIALKEHTLVIIYKQNKVLLIKASL